jgi:hypothetical protein
LLIPNTAPEVNDLLAAMIGTAGAAQLPAASEVVGKYLVHGLKAMTDVSLYRVWFAYRHGSSPVATRRPSELPITLASSSAVRE